MQELPFPLTLLRHGLTTTSSQTCMGQRDAPLSNKGSESAEKLARNWSLPRPERIVSSDLIRAKDTAQIIAHELGLQITTDKRLRELDFGQWEGMQWQAIYEADPAAMEAWGRDWVNVAAPGGENLAMLSDRVDAFLQDLQKQPPLPTLLVGHAGSLRAVYCLITQQPLSSLFSLQLEHCKPLELS